MAAPQLAQVQRRQRVHLGELRTTASLLVFNNS